MQTVETGTSSVTRKSSSVCSQRREISPYVHCAYYDSVDAKKWPKQMAVLTDEYERNDQGVPTWFNINYEDVDGNEMFQSFELKNFDGKLYYALNSINDA